MKKTAEEKRESLKNLPSEINWVVNKMKASRDYGEDTLQFKAKLPFEMERKIWNWLNDDTNSKRVKTTIRKEESYIVDKVVQIQLPVGDGTSHLQPVEAIIFEDF